MKCPHCLENFHASFDATNIVRGGAWLLDSEGYWRVIATLCPACNRATIALSIMSQQNTNHERRRFQVWPKGIARAPLATEVPEKFAEDYREACLVLSDSPKASAALSRRCLQLLLRDRAGVTKGDLSTEIDQVLKTLPSYLAEAVDAIRHVGNFAAHPNKSQHTGEILDVEPGEAEWLLDVLEGLFDFYFVQPARLAAKQAALDAKLAESGKPSMKKP